MRLSDLLKGRKNTPKIPLPDKIRAELRRMEANFQGVIKQEDIDAYRRRIEQLRNTKNKRGEPVNYDLSGPEGYLEIVEASIEGDA